MHASCACQRVLHTMRRRTTTKPVTDKRWWGFSPKDRHSICSSSFAKIRSGSFSFVLFSSIFYCMLTMKFERSSQSGQTRKLNSCSNMELLQLSSLPSCFTVDAWCFLYIFSFLRLCALIITRLSFLSSIVFIVWVLTFNIFSSQHKPTGLFYLVIYFQGNCLWQVQAVETKKKNCD